MKSCRHASSNYPFLLASLAVSIAFPTHVFSWSSDPAVNTPIAVAQDWQVPQAMIEDGLGGAIIAWTDGRNDSEWDVYAQRIDATGAVLWNLNGVPICTATGSQSLINIVSDGTGGAVLAWSDARLGPSVDDRQIYAQRINGSGIVQWSANGVLVAGAGSVSSPYLDLVSDGAGGVILVWEHILNGDVFNPDVYAQHIDVDGTTQWTPGGIPVSALGTQEKLPSIASDGSGGAIVAWTDGRDGGRAYAQRVNAAGEFQWPASGIPIVGDPTLSEGGVALASDGAGGALVLIMAKASPHELFVQRVDANGETLWPQAANIASYDPSQYDRFMFIGDGLGGAILTWDIRTSVYPNDVDIYAQGVDANGNLKWEEGGLSVGSKPYWDSTPISIVSDNAGGFIGSWMISDENYSNDIYAQHFNAAGLPQWGAEPVAVCTQSGQQVTPVTVGDGTGGAIFAWGDDRNGEDQYDVYAHRISAAGGSTGLQAPSNVSPADDARIDAPPTLDASAFVDDAGQLSHAASQWRVNDFSTVTPESPEHDISADDGYFTYTLPFGFPFFERTITAVSVNVNGLVELLEDGESAIEKDDYGTHSDGDHIGTMDAIFAANDDLDLSNGHLRLYNAGTRVVIEWYGATYADADADPNYPDFTNNMLFQVVLYQDGRILWNLNQLDFNLFDYDLYSGVYPNGGTEISVTADDLSDVVTPSTFEFNPVTRRIGLTTHAWFVPEPALYDSGETTDLVSHLVPVAAGLEDNLTYYWGVRYKGDNDEWSPWSAPTRFVADTLAPVVASRVPEHLDAGVVVNTVILATFSEALAPGSVDEAGFTLSGPAGDVAGTVDYTAMTASFTPTGDLAPDTTYTATITTAVTDTVGKQMEAPETWSFTTATAADTSAPSVETRSPGRNAVDVAVDIDSVSVTFTEPMNVATIHQSSFTLTGPNGAVVGAWSYDTATRTAGIDPDGLLAFATTYTVVVTDDIEDNAGNPLAPDSWTFTTTDAPPPPPLPDHVPPRVVSATPTAPAPASIDAITVTFSEPIQNIDTTSFAVSDSGLTVPGTVEYDAAAMTAWFFPAADLDYLTQYTVRISSTLIHDLDGNAMEQDYVGFFTTLGDPADEGCNPDAGQEAGCDSFDNFTYGTGAFVGLQGPPHSGFTAEYAARQSVSQGVPDSEVIETATAEMEATAQVNATRFRLRARSLSLQDNAGSIGAAANGAGRIEVHGAPPGAIIPMRLVISSREEGAGGALLLRVTDFDRFQTLATMESHVVDPGVLHLQMIDPYGANAAENFVRTEHVTLTSGFRWDFLYPATPNNGIHVNLAVHAANLTAGNEIDVTVTLEVDPPPGVTVTLASGQVFGGVVDTDGDGVSDLEEDSELSANNAAIAAPQATSGAGNIAVDVSANAGLTLSQVKVLDDDDLSLVQDGKPTDQSFPDGMVSFRLNGLAPGATATVDLTFPTAFPEARYFKVDELGFHEFPGAEFIDDHTVRLILTDGGSGDSDGLTNGVIDDPGGVAVPYTASPLLRSTAAGPGSATISWEPAASGYVLQETLSLSPANWLNSSSGTNNPVVVPTTEAAKFYRLKQP